MQCPNCKSEDLIKLSVVHSGGLSDIRTRSRGRGLTLGDTGLALGLGYFRTRGTSQTRLSKLANPPHKKPYWIVLLGWFLGFLIIGWLLGYMGTVAHAPEARLSQEFRWFAYTYSSLAAFALGALWGYNHRIFPHRLQLWNRSFMCRRCGSVVRPSKEQASPEHGAN